jgi:hypothetical protein
VAPRLGVKSFVASLVVLAGVLALSAPARGAAASPFREVAVGKGVRTVESDGVRFAWGQPGSYQTAGAVRVFDTLRGRNFRLAAPAHGCKFVWIGGGDALWNCYEPRKVFLQDLSTGRLRQPAGIEQVFEKASEFIYCNPLGDIGRYWLGFSCGNGFGPGDEPFYLNHRTGRLIPEFDPFVADLPFIDADYVDLFRPYCAPLGRPTDNSFRPPYFDYAPPFALHAPTGTTPPLDSIGLRRCGTKRAETLSRCPQTDCRTPQLGSDYVTWGEYKRVYAYLPRIRRRVLVGRAPVDFVRGRKLSVAHTCNRIFARWGSAIYEARFEPRHGAPPCQSVR